MNILISGIGGPSPRSVAKSLKYYSQLPDVKLFGVDMNKYARDLYNTNLYHKTFLVPSAKSKDYWPTINKIIKENSITIAIILPELEVIEWAKKQEYETLPCKTLIPDFKLANLLYDKAEMSAILEEKELVPKSMVLNANLSNLKQIENTLGYPFWIRSATGAMGLGSLKIGNKKTLENWLRINPEISKFLASEFLPGRNLACKMLYYNGELKRAACGERVLYIMSKIAPSGITGNTSFGRLLNDEVVFQRSKEALEFIMEQTGTRKHGFFTVDLKEDEHGNAFVTEVNIRHVAFSLCFTLGGINFAEDTVRLLQEDKSYDKNFKLHKFKEGLIFLRDVDETPIIMNESDLFE